MSEHAPLREALAEALWDFAFAHQDVPLVPPFPSPDEEDYEVVCSSADAILAVLPEHRDDVLALLGADDEEPAHDQGRPLADHERSRCTAGHVRQIADEGDALQADNDRLRALLADIYLYIDWRYITKQQTTEQRVLFADVVDAHTECTADRWWGAPDE